MITFHNCIKDAKDLEWVELGRFNKQRVFKCVICGSIWCEQRWTESSDLKDFTKLEGKR